MKYADTAILPFTFEDLKADKSCKKTLAKFHEVCDELKKDEYPSRTFSLKVVDANKKPLFFYLADRILDEEPKTYKLVKDPKNLENYRTLVTGKEKKDLAGKNTVFDGIPVSPALSFPHL